MRGWGRWLWFGSILALSFKALGAQPVSAQPSSPPGQALPDLDERPQDPASSATAAATDDALPPLRHALDIRLGVGARWFNQVDSDHLFLGNNLVGGYSNTSENAPGGPADSLLLSLALGYQHPSGLGIEVGFSPMPLESVYAMPLYRLAGPGLGSRPVLYTLGAQLGWATINGASDYYYYSYNNTNGNYLNGDVQMNTYAVVYRMEEMLNARLSLGLELAYHFAWANVSYSNDQYDPNTDTYTTTSYQTTLNYSGPSISLTLAAWPMAPFWTARDQAAVDQRQSRREEKLEERLERIEARRGPRDETQDYDSAAEAKAAGDAAMDKSRYSAAQAAYQQATLLAPGDSQAWRSLANAEYALGKHAKAYTHYKEALRLDPDNRPLRDFVAKLKDRLRQDLDLN